MQIGELSKATGTSVRALRHYEKKGLLESRRAENGYRVFGADSPKRVAYIRLFLDCGFGTREIAQFLPCYLGDVEFNQDSCPGGYDQYLHKMQEIDELIKVLNEKRARLHHVITNFGETDVSDMRVNEEKSAAAIRAA
jgi:DNA-binding transcriptional MerR regulator